jgi:hypothetical protein
MELVQDGKNGWVGPEPVNVESLARSIERALREMDRVRVLDSLREALSVGRMVAEFAEFIDAHSVIIEEDSSATR